MIELFRKEREGVHIILELFQKRERYEERGGKHNDRVVSKERDRERYVNIMIELFRKRERYVHIMIELFRKR